MRGVEEEENMLSEEEGTMVGLNEQYIMHD